MTPLPAPRWGPLSLAFLVLSAGVITARAQLDPNNRSLLQLGADQSLTQTGPQSLYGYYHYNDPGFIRTNLTLRLVVAPVYLDGEIGLREVVPRTDVGLGINGGGFGENQFELRQGQYLKRESFHGHGAGAALHLYHRLNPGQSIPLSLIVQGGGHYSAYTAANQTAAEFVLPADRVSAFVRGGLRLAGKEPLLYADLALEVSVWFEQQWRPDHGTYGFAGDRSIAPEAARYWLYAGMSYAWTNSGNQFTSSVMVGGSEKTDRFSAWRLGGVLPLAAEFPLTLPGYHYQELSARQFVHFSAAYVVPLSPSHRWQLRLGVASANVVYLPGFARAGSWHTGAGPSISYTSRSEVWRVVLRHGYGFDAQRNGLRGAQSLGLLYQYNFEQRRQSRGLSR